MPKRFYLFLAILVAQLITFSSNAAKNNWIFTSETHHYVVSSIDDYQSHHVFEGINVSTESSYFQLSVRDNSELYNLKLEYIKGKKRKPAKISQSTITSNISNGSFFNGRKTYYVPIEPNVSFSISYSVKEKNTIFISSFLKEGFLDAQSTSYSFELPTGLNASMSTGIKKSGAFQITKDNFKGENETIFMLIHPQEIDKEQFFSDWFQTRINDVKALAPEEIPSHLTELKEHATDEEMAEACFKYVQNDIRYLDIENGINAIIPRSCSFVLSNKYGDCKDMANTLVALLNHFDLEAYNCISKTNSREGTFNFPSLGKANHMIAGLKLNDEWIFLDPTEQNCLFGDPSIQILGTEAFAIGHKAQFFQKVSPNPKSKSVIRINYLVDIDKRTISVDFTFEGKPNTLIESIQNDDETLEMMNNRIFSYSLPNTEKKITSSFSTLTFAGELPKAFLSELSTKTILQTTFLADVKTLFVLAGYRTYPVYPIEITSKIKFVQYTCENIKSTEEYWTKNSKENTLEAKSNWNSFDSSVDFESSTEWSEFENKTKKPLIITP